MIYLKHVFTTVKKNSPSLYWIVIVLFVFAIGSILGSLIDDRTLMGVNVWIKPLKFSISTAIYSNCRISYNVISFLKKKKESY